MYVICDNQNIVRNYANIARYVKAQSNGVTILADSYRNSTAIYCEDNDTYWPTKEVLAGQETYTMYQVAEVPEGAEVNITRYNTGSLEIDEYLKAADESEKEAAEKEMNVSSQVTLAVKLYAETLEDEETICSLADIYDAWAPGIQYKAGKILSYGKDENGDTQLYRVVEPGHTSQADWTPDKTPALYTPIGLSPGGIPIWRQPTGVHDAYNTGDQCVHNGYIWTSKINGNTTEPGSDDRWWTKGEAAS